MAFLQELRDDGARDRVLPPLQGAELAFTAAELAADPPVAVDLVPVDLAESPDAVAAVAADPGFVAAIVGPDVRARPAIRGLVDAGLAVVDLSPFGRPVTTDVGAWHRLVPTLRAQGAELAAIAGTLPGARAGACLLADLATAVGLLHPAARALGIEVVRAGPTPPDAAGEAARQAGCRIVVFDGDGTSAAAATRDLAGEVPRAVLLGGDRFRYAPFISEAGRAAEGAISVCGCVDLSLSTHLPAQRFVQDYQSAYGRPPGPYAVEGWDAARAVLRGLGTVGTSRGAVTAWLATLTSFEGLGGRYAFDARGELAVERVHAAEVRGGRWVPLAPAP